MLCVAVLYGGRAPGLCGRSCRRSLSSSPLLLPERPSVSERWVRSEHGSSPLGPFGVTPCSRGCSQWWHSGVPLAVQRLFEWGGLCVSSWQAPHEVISNERKHQGWQFRLLFNSRYTWHCHNAVSMGLPSPLTLGFSFQ